MLPTEVPIPTLWTEEERLMLTGTSLEVGPKSLCQFYVIY